ncbi:hypothetical protein BC833DRAFT_564273 [Globomyces pollinis-pini]|nr:hypothetical protein BC833DRAFT_564273 [Globomyces pollinis-pini]
MSFKSRFSYLQSFKLNKTANVTASVSKLINSKELITTIDRMLDTESRHFKSVFGFHPKIKPSSIIEAGRGVYVEGVVENGEIVALYPGLVYTPGEPMFFVSLNNHYILRCFDGYSIDAKANGLSGMLYKSHYNRLKIPTPVATTKWMNLDNTHPLYIGHLINNGISGHTSNVRYQEININPNHFKNLHLIPNIHGSLDWNAHQDIRRIVCIVATRKIENEELFSTYYEKIQ